MNRIIRLTLLAVMAFVSVSCGNKKATGALLPNVSGKAGEVIVVVSKTEWDGVLGNTIRENLAADCDFLPQKEPLYTLVNITPATFSQIFKIHRNLLLYNIDPQVTKTGVIYKSDVWSHPQCVIQINAVDAEQANQITLDNMQTILTYIEQAERDRVINNAKLYEERSIRPVVEALAGGAMAVPSGYRIKKSTSDFIWIAYENTYIYQDMFVYKFPATHAADEFSLDNLVGYRNSVLQANVPGMFENTYMTTSTFATPRVTYMKYKGRSFAELRGLWEVQNDFMGGPFVSHAFYSQDGEDVIVIEAFVYAPRYDKRHYLRQVESLLYSFEWKSEEKK